MEDQNQVPIQVQSPIPTKHKFSTKSIVLFLGAILIVGSIAFYGFSQFSENNKQNNDSPESNQENNPPLTSPNSILYGNWTSSNSHIRAYNLQTGEEKLIAKLPVNIKKVSILSDDEILYINNTNTYDQGDEIVAYSLSSQTSRTIVKASPGVLIDDYVLSPNKRYLATWELANAEGLSVLIGGQSHIYTVDLNTPERKNRIYQETPTYTNPIHYPSGITDDGTVYADKFLPNSYAGWAHGMSSSSFNGVNKTELNNMTPGTYSTKPVMSPDGKSFAFAGYNGTFGDGTQLLGKFRQALTTPNTIDILDIQTQQRVSLANLSAENFYPYVKWDGNNRIIYYMIADTPEQSGLYAYDLNSNTSQQLNTSDTKFFVTSLDNGLYLVGDKGTQDSFDGNLGNQYESPYTQLKIINPNDSSDYTLQAESALIQFIDIVSSDFLSPTVGEIINSPSQRKVSNEGSPLKLGAAPIKPAMTEKRQELHQNPPPTEEVPTPTELPPTAAPRREKIQPTFSTGPTRTPAPTSTEPKEEKIYCIGIAREICTKKHPENAHMRGLCIEDTIPQLKQSGQCNSSPLYLYGTEGMRVTATIHTPIFDSNAAHSNNKYEIIIGKNGSMQVGGSIYDGIDYNYISALKFIRQPQYGSIAKKSEVEKTLREFAKHLGLNQKETRDLVAKGKAAIKSPYAFISFYDHETSHAILPITFTPQPDVYRNIVFYFKNLDEKPKYSVQSPKFEKIVRKGFTAIEVSSIVD